jgi:3-oxoadipate enol-lactonase
MPELNVPFGTLHYEVIEPEIKPEQPDAAPAQSLTLLHNFLSSGRAAWSAKLLEQLGGRYRILLPDLPGHGRSQGYPEHFDYLEIARAIAELMHHEGADRGHLAGCSAGGMIAQLLVHHELVEPATLTLVSTTHSTSPQTTGEPVQTHPENFRAGDRWLEATAQLHDPHLGEGYFNRVLLPAFRQLTPANTIDLPLSALESFIMPACIIHGSEDEFFPLPIARRMAAHLPQGELHVIPDQTHALIFRRPWVVGQRMADFLERHHEQTPA